MTAKRIRFESGDPRPGKRERSVAMTGLLPDVTKSVPSDVTTNAPFAVTRSAQSGVMRIVPFAVMMDPSGVTMDPSGVTMTAPLVELTTIVDRGVMIGVLHRMTGAAVDLPRATVTSGVKMTVVLVVSTMIVVPDVMIDEGSRLGGVATTTGAPVRRAAVDAMIVARGATTVVRVVRAATTMMETGGKATTAPRPEKIASPLVALTKARVMTAGRLSPREARSCPDATS